MSEPRWMFTPESNGLYWYAKSVKDWDIGHHVEVIRIENPKEIYLEVEIPPFPAGVRTTDSFFNNAVWWGPMPTRVRPSKEFVNLAESRRLSSQGGISQ